MPPHEALDSQVCRTDLEQLCRCTMLTGFPTVPKQETMEIILKYNDDEPNRKVCCEPFPGRIRRQTLLLRLLDPGQIGQVLDANAAALP